MSEAVSYIDYFTDYKEVRQSLFLGKKLGLVENLRNEFPDVWKQYKFLKSLDWDENEIDISSCRAEFKTLNKEITDLMINTLAWQFEADSSAAHIGSLMYPFVNNTEMYCYLTELSKNECLTPDHEVLTPQGWKPISEITANDSVAQWNYKTKVINFVSDFKIITKDYNDDLVHIYSKDKSLEQLVTLDHRVPVFHDDPDNNIQFQYARDLNFTDKESFPVSGYLLGKTSLTHKEEFLLAIHLNGKNFNTKRTFPEETSTYKIVLTSLRKIERFKTLCSILNLELIESKLESSKDYRQKVFYIAVPSSEFCENVSDLNSWIDIASVSSNWCKEFTNKMLFWTNSSVINYYYATREKTNADLVSLLYHVSGRRTKVSHRVTSGNEYRVTPLEESSINGCHIKTERVKYKGKVYCLQVPSTYFMVKYKNSISVTGNCLHSLAYKVIVEYSFDNPEEFLTRLLSIKESFERLDVVKKVFDEIYSLGHRYALGEQIEENTLRRAIFKFWVALLALERIQFISSFAITFGLAEQGYFVPIAKLVQKICTDEFQVHVQTDKIVLKNEMNIEDNFSAYLDSLEDISAIVKEVTDSELRWLDFLFGEKTEIAKIKKAKIREFVIYSASEVYSFLSIPSPYETIKDNPLPYMNKWIVIDSNQSSPQEESVGNYLLGGFIDDSTEFDSSKLNLSF